MSKRNTGSSRDQGPRPSGNRGDSQFRPELPVPKGDGGFPRASRRRKKVPSIPKAQVVARLFKLGLFDHANAVLKCGRTATLFECPNHDIFVPRYCGRPYCPTCGQDGSQSHMRRYSRVVDRIHGVRFQKDVVTLPEWLIPKTASAASKLMNQLGDWFMLWYCVPASLVVLHWMGENTQGIHCEVLTPSRGNKTSPGRMLALREYLADRWDADLRKIPVPSKVHETVLPVVNHQYIAHFNEVPKQRKKWWHGTRYATHPTGYNHRWEGMTDESLKDLVEMMSGFHTVRGYGLWSNRYCNSAAAREWLPSEYPIDMGDEVGDEDLAKFEELHDGGACPICGLTIHVHRRIRKDGLEVIPSMNIPQGVVEVLPGVYGAPSRADERRRMRGWGLDEVA